MCKDDLWRRAIGLCECTLTYVQKRFRTETKMKTTLTPNFHHPTQQTTARCNVGSTSHMRQCWMGWTSRTPERYTMMATNYRRDIREALSLLYFFFLLHISFFVMQIMSSHYFSKTVIFQNGAAVEICDWKKPI